MNSATTRLLILCLCTLSIGQLAAQPAAATFRPALLESYSVGFARTAEGDLRGAGSVTGRIAVNRTDFNVTGRTRLGDATLLLHGLAYARNALDLSGTGFLPEALEELTLSLGVQHRQSAAWSLAAYLRPGFYGESLEFKSKSFNAPLLATAIYSASPELAWILGFSANAASDNPFIPIAGVRWQFAPDWTLNVGFPRAGVSYRHSERLSLNAGATVQGGGYYITESRGIPIPGSGRLARTWLEYREIRLGVGAELALSGSLSLAADLGWVADQRFDYFDRGFELKGDHPLFVAVALKGRF
jgi:hypothetical protein